MLQRVVLPVFALFAVAAGGAEREVVGEPRPIEITMRDGRKLAADLFLPSKAGKVPCVLIQTPYDRRRMRRAFTGDAAGRGPAGRGARGDLAVMLDRERYAYLVVDWRGFYGSRAAMQGVNKRRWRRGQDGYDCVEWIAKQAWSNGKVGTWGGSALGKQQLDTAAEKPPHLVCAVPLIAAQGQRYESYYEGGVPLDAHLRRLDQLGYQLRTRVLRNTEPNTPLWRLAERRSYRPQDIDVPCLFITGWWDNYPDQVIRNFRDVVAEGGAAARAHSQLLVGPWDHVSIGLRQQGGLEFPRAERVSGLAAKAFLDRWLLGIRAKETPPRVRWFDSGSREWHAAERFPEQGERKTTWTLHADGQLGTEREGNEARVLRYVHDPADPTPTLGGANLPPLPHGPTLQNRLLRRQDLLVFRSGALSEPLALRGRVEVTLRFRIDRDDADFCLRLCDVDSKGNMHLLADRAQRLRLRAAKPVKAEGGWDRVSIEFGTLMHSLQPGHELLLIVASSNVPRYERNTHDGSARWDPEAARPVTVELRTGPGSGSTISF